MPKIEVSNGELIDKLTILRIKKAKGLDVDKDLSKVEELAHHIWSDNGALVASLKEVNTVLWILEDNQRSIREMCYDCDIGITCPEFFMQTAKQIFELNEERHRIKKEIDELTGSKITEQKSYTA